MSARVMRTWAPLVEPDEIEGVRDKDGDLWRPGRDSGWFNCGSGRDAWTRSVDRVGDDWPSVMRYAPLREVTEAGERVGPIEITQAMVDAACAVQWAGVDRLTGGAVAVVVATALRAGGYEVTGVDEQ